MIFANTVEDLLHMLHLNDGGLILIPANKIWNLEQQQRGRTNGRFTICTSQKEKKNTTRNYSNRATEYNRKQQPIRTTRLYTL